MIYKVIFLHFILIFGPSLSNKIKVETTATNVKLESLITTKSSRNQEGKAFEFDPQVNAEINKILTVNNHCNIIRSFSLSQNFSFNCFEKYLPIEFVLTHHSGEKLLTAYLDTNNNDLQINQELLTVCRKIRRQIDYIINI